MLHHIVDLILKQLSNPFIGGGFLMMFVGAIVAYFRKLPGNLWFRIKSQFMVEVSVLNNDPLFDWLTLWLNDHPYSKKTRRLIATTLGRHQLESNCAVEATAPTPMQHGIEIGADEEVKRPQLILSPAKGQHFFIYRGTLLWLSRGDETTPQGSNGSKKQDDSWRFKPETYTLRIIGRSQVTMRGLLNEVIDRAMSFQAKKISAFVGVWSSWRRLRTFRPRSMDSVILPDGVSESILQRLKDFIADKAWYQEMGIPYHLGMMFHGTPGSGKTSIIAALAGALKMNVYVLNLAGEHLTDEHFACLLSDVPPGSFMVIEDVDAVPATQRRVEIKEGIEGKGLTLTGILNALDGFMASEGSIVLMTTNHKDKLDPALIRPGRVDFEVEFEVATQSQLRRLYQRFFPNSNGDAEIWAMAAEGKTMAEAQQELLQLKKSAAKETTPVPSEQMKRCPYVFLDGWRCVMEDGHEPPDCGGHSAAVQNLPADASWTASGS